MRIGTRFRCRRTLLCLYTIFYLNSQRLPSYYNYANVDVINQKLLQSHYSKAILTHCRLSTIKRNHHTNFHENISIHDWIIISFWHWRRHQSAILNFPIPCCIFENLISAQWVALGCWFSITVGQHISVRCWFSMCVPNLAQKVDRPRNYGPKSKCKMAIRYLGFLKSDFWSIDRLWQQIFHHCTKFDKKCLSMSKLWPTIKIQDGDCPPS